MNPEPIAEEAFVEKRGEVGLEVGRRDSNTTETQQIKVILLHIFFAYMHFPHLFLFLWHVAIFAATAAAGASAFGGSARWQRR